jgi:putative peptidoglycan lipid II flippase
VLYRREHLKPDGQLKRRALGMVGASLAMGIVLYVVRTALFTVVPAGLAKFGALAGLIAAGLVTYAVAVPLLGAYNFRDIKRVMSRRRLRSGSGSAISPVTTTEA